MLQRQNLIAIMMILSARPSQVKLQGSITGTSLHWEFNLQSNVGVNLRVNKSDQPRGANAGLGRLEPVDHPIQRRGHQGPGRVRPDHCLEYPGWRCGQKGRRLEGSQADWVNEEERHGT